MMNLFPANLTVRVGCHIVYQTSKATPMLLVLRPRRDDRHKVVQEMFSVTPGPAAREFEDVHGNMTSRAILQPGQNIVHHDAIVTVSSQPDNANWQREAVPVDQLPAEVLRYTLPSRYCDSDKLLNFAWQQFGQVNNGLDRVLAISNWVHSHIEYRFGSGRTDTAASDVIQQGYGVCRDFAHVTIALCRAFNLPARYVVGHLPDIGYTDPGTPMDFHAYCEVYLGQTWCIFDARYNEPRIGRIKVAQGLDAVDGAFASIYGEAQLAWFEVWAYQVVPGQVSVGDLVDLSRRLDGTPLIRFQ
jgi:transglutaminase-like putative cysteine protease